MGNSVKLKLKLNEIDVYLNISVMAVFEMGSLQLAQVVRALRAMQDKYPTPAGGGFSEFFKFSSFLEICVQLISYQGSLWIQHNLS